MFKLPLAAAAFAAVGSLPAAAQATDQTSASGHYEWRAAPQAGPRAPATGQHRIWVAANRHTAECDCPMPKAQSSTAPAVNRAG